MKRRVGRPRSVEHGTERRQFEALLMRGDVPRSRYCTVAWMIHHGRLSATATYRDPSHDLTYLGMAQGEVDGPYYRRGDTRPHGVLALTGREPSHRSDHVEAVVTLAVQSLEATVAEAVCGPAPEAGDHPWVIEAREAFEERVASGRRRKAVRA